MKSNHLSRGSVFLTVCLILCFFSTLSHASPNLTPYKPIGWSDKIVVSKTAGTTLDSTVFYTTDSLYVDWAVVNDMTTATTATTALFYVTLYVDGVKKDYWYRDTPLSLGSYVYIKDYLIGSLSAGSHAIKIVVDDTFAISETDERDNEYTKTITVVEPCTIPEALENSSLTFTTGGNANWSVDHDIYYSNACAVISGDIGDSQSTWIETIVQGPAQLSFYWKVSSEPTYDYLQFTVDGTEKSRISGVVAWQQKQFTIPTGSHTLRWSYKKDVVSSIGSDAGWLDKIVIAPVAPTVSIGSPSPTKTNTGPVTYTVSYENADAITLSAENVTLNRTDTATGTVSVSGTGTTTRTVTISGITGNGTLGISIAAGTASNSATDQAPAAGPSATVTVDNTPPIVSAGGDQVKKGIFTQTGTATDANTLTYAWTQISGPGTITFGTSSAVSTTVSASADGTYTLRLTATDAAGNSASSDMTLVWDTTAPTVSIGVPSATVTSTGPVTYTISYAGADAITLSSGNIILNKTNTANGSVSVSGTGNTRVVTISGITGNGTLGISIGAGTASDQAGNQAQAAGPSATFFVKNAAPVVSAGENQTKNGSFTVTATAQDASPMTYNWSKLSGPGVVTFGSATMLSTTVSASTEGTYVLRFTATNSAGSSSFSDMTLVWDTTAPTVSIANPSAARTASGPVTYTVTYANADAVTLSPENIILNKTNTANGLVSVSGAGNTRIVTISGITGNGTLGISLNSGTAGDLAGNRASAAGPSATFTVFNANEKYRLERMWPALPQPWYFQNIRGMAMDSNGNIYVLSTWENRIMKFTSNFQFITSWGRPGSGDGEFDQPNGIAIDSNNNVFIVDQNNNRIQKFNSHGAFITKFGSAGSGDGQLKTSDSSGYYTGIVVTVDGSVFVTDMNNHRIQKFKPVDSGSGVTSYIFDAKWGSYGTGNGQFNKPMGLCMDKEGNFYVSDRNNDRVQKFTSSGQFVQSWGGYGSGNGQMYSPSGIVVDGSGNVYVADYNNNRIQKFDANGNYLAQWGSYGNGDGQFWGPVSLLLGKDGSIYVGEYWYHRIQKLTSTGAFVTSWQSWSRDAGMFFPNGVALDGENNLYVADSNNYTIKKISPQGQVITSWGGYGTGDGQFKNDPARNLYSPYGIAVDSQGKVFVSDVGNNRIQKFKPVNDGSGNITYVFDTKWGGYGTGDGYFRGLGGIDVDGFGNVYVVDALNNRIQKFKPVNDGSGNITYVFDTKWGSQGTGDGQFRGSVGSFSGIAADNRGNIYVADNGNNRIQKFDANGTFVKAWGSYGQDDGQLDRPFNVAVDSDGNVYVADTYNDRVQKFTADGTFITKFGGTGTMPGLMRQPHDLAVNANSDVYVVEFFTNRIQSFKKVTAISNSKAIIVAGGGPFPGNNLWEATQMSANFAYRALTTQGFTKDSIYYLSSNTGLDLDENGVADDIAGDATNANLESAIVNWASDAGSLMVYLIDHGGTDTFRMSENQTLSAATLASWLNRLQTGRNIPVTVIYEACYSGSFVDDLKPPQDKKRTIITSTSPGEEASFLSQGSISFSNYFWTKVLNGVNIKDAFSLARDATTRTISTQHPLLDANGNSTANEPEDLSLVQNMYIGNGATTLGGAPVIAELSPDQTISGVNSALLYANGVTDPDGIQRVWAVIHPPSYQSSGKGLPIQDLPSLDFMPVGNNRYEATYTSFTTPGTYQIAVYALDRKGNTSIPKLTTVSVNSPLRRKAVIVAGGSPADAFWPAVEKNARMAYNTMKSQGYVDEDIYFLSPVAASQGFDATPSLDNLRFAVTTWAGEQTQDLVLYLIGNGGNGTFMINGTETLNANDLKTWLDALQEKTSAKIVAIYDGPFSGGFLPLLKPPAGKERILLSSAASNQTANFPNNGDISFSSYFWAKVANGMNIWDAFVSGSKAMDSLKQTPLLDANGNGIGNEKADGRNALNYTIGFGILLAADDPLIGAVSPAQILTGKTSAAFWAKDITTTGSIAKVWAVITPPGSGQGTGAVTDLPTVDLQYNAASGRYEGTYRGFNTKGEYTVAIFAQDNKGNISLPLSTTVTQSAALDPYEDDDSPANAFVIVLNDTFAQTHNFHTQGDADWVKFYALENTIYRIETANVGADADIVLELFDRDGTTLIRKEDLDVQGRGEWFDWTAPKSGIYYVRVSNYDPSLYGENTNYDLKVHRPVAPDLGTIQGIVVSDRDFSRISSAMIQAALGSALSQAGNFTLRVEAGIVNLSIIAEGYDAKTVQNVEVKAGTETTVTIRLETPRESQTITFNAIAAKAYGDVDFDLSATASSGLAVSFALVSGPARLNGSTVTITGVGSIVVKASQAGNDSYSAAEVSQTIVVSAKALIITANNATRAYGAVNPANPGFSASGLVAGDAISGVTFTYAATANATALGGTTHAITPSAAVFGSGSAPNYAITYRDGTLTITITPGDLNGDSSVTLADLIIALRAMAGINPPDVGTQNLGPGADLNGDGKIGIQEAVFIAQKLAGLR